MSRKAHPGINEQTLREYEEQCAGLGEDWRRLQDLLRACQDASADQDQLEGRYISLRSNLSCDYPILTYWRDGGYGLTAGINRLLDGAPDISALINAARQPDNTVQRWWKAVAEALDKVTRDLNHARSQLEQGKDAVLPPELLRHDTHVPFPIRKILRGMAIVVGCVLAATTFYVMRNFLGFWAPEAGSALVVTEDMPDEVKIQGVLGLMNEAFRANDLDRFMTVIANDFRDDEGNGRTALRVALQALKEKGEFQTVYLDWSRFRITERNGLLDVRPIYVELPDDRFSIHLGFKPYGDKLLIATGSST